MEPSPDRRARQLADRAETRPEAVTVAVVLDLLGHRDPAVLRPTISALDAVVSVRPAEFVPAIPGLIDVVRRPDDPCREGALTTLTRFAVHVPEEVAPYADVLAAATEGTDPRERTAAMGCLAAIAPADPGALIEVDAVPIFVGAITDSAAVRRGALLALGAIAESDPDVVAPHAPLLVAVFDPDERPPAERNDRAHAATALGRIAGVDPDAVLPAVEPAVEALDSTSGPVRTNVTAMMADLADRRPAEIQPYTDRFASLLSDDHAGTRSNATSALARIAATFPETVSPAIPALRECLSDERSKARENACLALGYCAESTVADDLRVMRDRDPDPGVRERAAWALARIE